MTKAIESATGGSSRNRTGPKKVAARKTAKTGVTGFRAANPQPRSDRSVDFVIDLPGGQAKVTIEAKRGVRRTAERWMRTIERLARTSLTPDALLVSIETTQGQPTEELTPAELAELEVAGARPASPDAIAAGSGDRAARQVALLADALDVNAAAHLLGVDPTRIRQRLRERSLYGIRRDSRTWLLPRFQFDGEQEIPHLGEVLRALPDDLHPRSVEGFLSVPKPELVDDRDEPTTPREWLRTGGPAGPVVALASALAVS